MRQQTYLLVMRSKESELKEEWDELGISEVRGREAGKSEVRRLWKGKL